MQSILVIEDDKDLLEEISESLEFSGYRVYETNNGKAAVELAKSLRPDLILCDIMIPLADGFQVLEQLKNSEITNTIPFIFITSLTDRSNYRNGMELGADDYLTKPFTEKELTTAIHVRLEKHQHLIVNNLSPATDSKLKETVTIMRDQIHHQQKLLDHFTLSKRSLSESLHKTENELKEVIIKSIENYKILEFLKKQLTEKLLTVNLTSEYYSTVQNMIHKIDRIINKKDSLREFQIKFNQINPEFSNWIMKAYPNLTQLELTLVSAILLNLNSNQIASLLFISPESVRKYRYRLKLKLNLSSEESLLHFVHSFKDQHLKKD